jgi:SAM-dependent methyltransferase
MSFFSFIGSALSAKEMDGVDLNSEDRLVAHRAVLNKKRILRNVFSEFHDQFMNLDIQYFANSSGLRLELGAGVCPIKGSYAEVLSTDIVASDDHDMALDAQSMGLEGASVRAIYGSNCFHHFSDPDKFFLELTRVLSSGGGAILIEPYHGPLASLMYKHLFSVEGFDKKMKGWKTPTSGPASDANQALSYVIFKRDISLFNQKYPELTIVYQRPLMNYMRYFMSGGLNFTSLVPQFMEMPLRIFEFLMIPLVKIFALHHVIVIKRK